MPTNPNILIMGGSGFIGTHLNLFFQEENIPVLSIDKIAPRLDSLFGVHEKIDILFDNIWDYIVSANIIFYCVGQTSHTDSIKNPLLDNRLNCQALLRIIEICQSAEHKPLIIYPSSTSLYGRGIFDNDTESSLPRPIDIYSAHKLVAEHYLRIYRRLGIIDTVILRLPNCYGPFGNPEPKFGVINHFIEQARHGKSLSVYGNGTQMRNTLFVQDAIKAMTLPTIKPELVLSLSDGVFNVAGDHVAVNIMAKEIAKIWDIGIEYIDWPEERKQIELGDVYISGRRFRDATGWRPEYLFADGVNRTHEDYDNRRVGAHRQRAISQ